jgi:uncharacterized glyoxalase superfamily protein PhnB
MATRDMSKPVEHHQRLGFRFSIFENGEFAIAQRDGFILRFSVNKGHDPLKTASWIYLRVNDADSLYREWKAAGVERLREPRDTTYGMREGSHIDPEGNLVVFGSGIRKSSKT